MSESLENLSHYIRNSFHSCVRGRLILPEIQGDFAEFPSSMNPLLSKALNDLGIEKLYSHQKESFESVRKGNNTILLSRTASGKTFSFLLPILNDYAEKPGRFTTLLLYPTKALSRDQESALGKILRSVSGDAKFGVFDGDTAREDRESLVKYADFILSNPDMLHSGILPNHSRKWRNFLSRLKYIVVDESHIYRGAFGS
ncbi:MAG TPA: DEAD/DEAH box helicase, partial [Leptospiraceae bacterium]|nr:DEAD/DEAH box helicase [Leptospiraceae bacterium]